MPTPAKGARLGGGPAHERLMLANLATALFENGKITTTEAKAKRLRPLAERLITFAKRGDLHARRRVMTVVRDKSVVHELFTEIGPRYENRNGGYTRVTKIGPRKGDNAPMAVIELVEALTAKAETVQEAEAATKKAATKKTAQKAPAKKATAKKAAAAAAEAEAAGEQALDAGTAGDAPAASEAAADAREAAQLAAESAEATGDEQAEAAAADAEESAEIAEDAADDAKSAES